MSFWGRCYKMPKAKKASLWAVLSQYGGTCDQGCRMSTILFREVECAFLNPSVVISWLEAVLPVLLHKALELGGRCLVLVGNRRLRKHGGREGGLWRGGLCPTGGCGAVSAVAKGRSQVREILAQVWLSLEGRRLRGSMEHSMC